jgi:uncharacterized membrane protein
MANVNAIASLDAAPLVPSVRRIGPQDLKDALAKGLDDFWAMPTHVVFISLMYPIIGLFLARLTFGYDLLPLLFPLMSGFALIGPFAGLGLYELSRRREQGLDTAWSHAFEVLRSPSIGAILALGVLLLMIFACWLFAAQALYDWLFGPQVPDSVTGFLHEVLTTPHGWLLIILGNAIGFVFAAVVLAISVVSFPLLLDRQVGVAVAVHTSVKAVLANPVAMATWGFIVAAALAIGSLPVFVGLAIVLPVLGHATWHLYRRVVAP